MQSNKKAVLSGVFWKLSEGLSSQIVSLVVSIILARIIAPSEYGVISLVMVFITISSVFISSGFGSALIQKKNADDLDFSSVFYFSLFFTSLIYLTIFCLSSVISNFFEMPILEPLLKVLSVSIIIMGVNSVQQAYISRKMKFKKFFYASFIGTFFSAVIGVSFALKGLGVWALVAQALTNNIVDTFILFISITWRPKLLFSYKRLKSLFSYGWKILLQSFVIQIYASLRSIIIGKFYTSSDLAYFTKGNQFPNLISSNIDSAINTVLFPVMSMTQDSLERVKSMARKTTQVTSYVMNPILIGLATIADSFVLLILTDKWLPCVPYFRICCFILLFRAPQTAILQAIKAVGRSDCVLKVDFPIRIFALIVLLISIQYGVLFLAFSELLITIFGTVLYARVAKEIIGYSGKEVCIDFLINTFLSIIMGFFAWVAGLIFPDLSLLKMLFQISIGILIYILLSVVTKNENFYYVINILLESMNRLKK
nr:lipopolysaccharide biosynthesis protein [Succinivibrio faecicola]